MKKSLFNPLRSTTPILSCRTLGLSSLCCLLLTYTVTAQAESNREIPKLNVGVTLPLSGSQKQLGEEIKRGLLFAQKRDAKDKLSEKITLIILDNASQIKKAAEQVTTLTRDRQAHIIVGGMSTMDSMAIGEAALKVKKLHLSLGEEPVYSHTLSNTFFLSDNSLTLAATLGRLAATKLKIKKVTMLINDQLLVKQKADQFAKSFTNHGGKNIATLVVNPPYNKATLAQLRALKGHQDSALYLGEYYPQAHTLIKMLKEIGWRQTILADESFNSASGKTFKKDGLHLIPIYFLSHFSKLVPDSTTQSFSQAYYATYKKQPSYLAAAGYDAYHLLKSMLEGASTNLTSTLKHRLLGLSFKGATGSIQFTKAGNDGNGIKTSKTNYLMKQHLGQVKFEMTAP